MLKQFYTMFKKEFMSYFLSYNAYFVIALYIFISMISSFYFGAYFQTSGTYLYSFFLFQPQILLFIIPAITMHSWADEKRSGTFEIVLAYPISYKTIVLAKFFACLALSVLMISLTFPLWVYSAFNSNVDNMAILLGYAGCIFAAAMFCAISCFVSSTNSSSIVSYIASVLVIWILTNIDFNVTARPLAYISDAVYISALGAFNFNNHYNSFNMAQLSLDNILYFVSFIFLALFMNKMVVEDRKEKSWINISLSGVLFFVILMLFNLFSSILFSTNKIDLTSDRRYSLSDASREIISQISEPIEIKVYLSKNLGKTSPAFGEYSQFVLNFLEKYKRQANGRINIDIRNPERYSVVEREAKENGIDSFLGKGENEFLYFGAVISNSSGESQVINIFLPQRQEYLERDISRIIFRLNNPSVKKVAWVNTLEYEYYDEVIASLAGDNYKVVKLSTDELEIPLDVDVLVVVNFQHASEFLSYGIDQFLMRGGRVLAFLDNSNPQMKSSKFSLYTPLILNKWGVDYNKELVVTDNILANQEIIIQDNEKKFVKEVIRINVGADNINQNNIITKGLNNIRFVSPALIKIEDSVVGDLETTGLINTSSESGTFEASLLKLASSRYIYENQDKNFETRDLSLLIEGESLSIFSKNILEGTKYEEDMLPFLPLTVEPAKLLLVADVDILDGEDWSYYGDNITTYSMIAKNNNIDFVIRGIDHLSGNELLLRLGINELIQNEKNLYDKFRDKIRTKYSSELEQIYNELLDKENEAAKLEKSLKTQFSMLKVREAENLNKEIAELKEENKYIDYIISSEANNKVYRVVLYMSVVLSILAVALMFVIVLLFVKRQQRKVLGMLNETKK